MKSCLTVMKTIQEININDHVKDITTKEDQRGISSLIHEDNLITDNTKKANILNGQFQSVFTSRSPLSLSRLAHMKRYK